MKNLKISIILLLACASFINGDVIVNSVKKNLDKADVIAEDDATTQATSHPKPTTIKPTTIMLNTTTEGPKTTTTEGPKTTTSSPNTTTTSPPTTTVNPNTTTVGPKTTTASPNTTTVGPKTTTASPNTTTTTLAPNTTTVAPITTTTKKPSPSPTPEKGTWMVNITGTNINCIIAKMAIQIELNKTLMNVPKDANATGNCGKNEEKLILSWKPSNQMTFTFSKNNKTIDLKRIDVTVVNGTNGTAYNLTHQKEEFSTPLEKSYLCNQKQTLKLNSTVVNNKNLTANLYVMDVQIQAFRNSNNTNFADAIDCLGSGTPDVVPIAVGCALVGLVIIMLVVYLIGRRRSQARGYTSM